MRWETRKRAGVVLADGTPGGLPGSGDFYQGILGMVWETMGAQVKSVGALRTQACLEVWLSRTEVRTRGGSLGDVAEAGDKSKASLS